MRIRPGNPPHAGSSRGVPAGRTLRAAREITEDVRDGLLGPGARRALRRLRWMLGACGTGFADLTGSTLWVGDSPGEAATSALAAAVLHRERARSKPPLTAHPLHVHGELAGVLLVFGPARTGAVREVASLVQRALERESLEASSDQAAQAELRALRAEISPHFTHNALTVIASLVRSDPDRAHELMLDFADYTRYSLARRGEHTTLSDEFYAVETYLALQRAVLGDRLRVQVRVAPEALGVVIPYLVLEPLVENAIRHGIEPRAGAGTVLVRGEAEGNDCVISIEDDGVGMDPELAEQILAGKVQPSGVGLVNADRRLRAVYGPWFGLVVETAIDAGTRIVVRVPRFHPGVML